MTEAMTRRMFMKGAVAAAAAVTLSGVLAGCGGKGDNGYNVGEFRVYFNSKPVYGWLDSSGEGFVRFSIGIKGVQNGVSFNRTYSEVFAAEVNEQGLAMNNGGTGIILQGMTVGCEPYFKVADRETYDALLKGEQPLKLTITLSTVPRTFVFDLKNNTMTAQ